MTSEGFYVLDRLVITDKRTGKVLRKTGPKEGIGKYWVRFLKVIGLGQKYATDLVMDAGLADITDMVMDRYSYISVGIGATTPVRDQVQLESQIQSRMAGTKSKTTTFYDNDTFVIEADFEADNDEDLTESGVHVESSYSGTDVMLARETFPTLPVVRGSVTTFHWEFITSR